MGGRVIISVCRSLPRPDRYYKRIDLTTDGEPNTVWDEFCEVLKDYSNLTSRLRWETGRFRMGSHGRTDRWWEGYLETGESGNDRTLRWFESVGILRPAVEGSLRGEGINVYWTRRNDKIRVEVEEGLQKGLVGFIPLRKKIGKRG